MATTDPTETTPPEAQTSEATTETDDLHRIRVAVEAALDRKAEDLAVLDLGAISDFTDHFLICNGSNERQVQAIADSIREKLREERMRPMHVEGLQQGSWILLDYGGEMVVHVFLRETREFYALERLWADAPDITSQFVQ